MLSGKRGKATTISYVLAVSSRPPTNMVVSIMRAVLVLALVVTTVAHIASHDNILRIQLWDAEGLSRTPDAPVQSSRKTKVDLETLYNAMVEESHGSDFSYRLARHKVRHKRRRPRQSADQPWKFHAGEKSLNIKVLEEESGVQSDQSGVTRDANPPLRLRQDQQIALEVKTYSLESNVDCLTKVNGLTSTRLRLHR